MFEQAAILGEMEKMRRPNGAFIASPTKDYSAVWIRDTLYATFSYWYINDFEKLKQGVWSVFNIFKKYKKKIKTRIASPIDTPGAILHAKYDPDNFEEITSDDGWGHHQLDAIGLFLHIVADLDFKNIRLIRDEEDLEILQIIVDYLRSVEYWHKPDFGMWEECRIRHSSSIGAVVGGLSYIRKQRLAIVPDPLIKFGEEMLNELMPFESRDFCGRSHHNHEFDSSQLSLIWPYHVIVKPANADELISKVMGRLLQNHGLNRYWGDDYYRSTEDAIRGISAEWPMFKFWLSIIFSQKHDYEKAAVWFKSGCLDIVDNKIPEAYQNNKPNIHTPLTWAHAISLIAFNKLPFEFQQQFLK